MTEVEEELARTKTLLQQLQSGRQDTGPAYPQERGFEDSQDTRSPDGDTLEQSYGTLFSRAVASSRQVSTADETDDAIGRTDNQTSLKRNRAQNFESLSQINARISSSEPTATSPNRPILSPTSRRTLHRRKHGASQRESETHSITTSLEAPPSSGSFEWDERTGKASGDRFVDGMASLTSRSNEGGYLGIISWAWCIPIC